MRSSDDLAHIRAVFLSGKVGYKRNFTGALQGTLMPHTKRRDLTGQKRSTQYKSSQRHFKDIHQAETIANWQLLKMLHLVLLCKTIQVHMTLHVLNILIG